MILSVGNPKEFSKTATTMITKEKKKPLELIREGCRIQDNHAKPIVLFYIRMCICALKLKI